MNAVISDLFFNYNVGDAEIWENGEFRGWDEPKLTTVAEEFIENLYCLGVTNLPTPHQLARDFLNRV